MKKMVLIVLLGTVLMGCGEEELKQPTLSPAGVEYIETEHIETEYME